MNSEGVGTVCVWGGGGGGGAPIKFKSLCLDTGEFRLVTLVLECICQ